MAVVEGDTTLAAQHEAMTRGHVERLAPMVAEVLSKAGLTPMNLDGIAVTTGPGSFTGARLGVSFARGLAMAAKAPAAGISVFEAMRSDLDTHSIVALPGKNGSFLLQSFFPDGTATTEPADFEPTDVGRIVPESGAFTITGTASEAVMDLLSEPVRDRATLTQAPEITAEQIARLGARAWSNGSPKVPAPLYVRAADAKPQMAAHLG